MVESMMNGHTTLSAPSSAAGAIRNPILPGFNPDPSIVAVGEDYFLATSSFEYFPGVPIYHSKDLTTWSLIGHALNRPSQLFLRSCEAGAGIFAPTIRYYNKRFYVTTVAVHRKSFSSNEELAMARGFYVWTDDIWSNRWSDPIYYDVLGIDQDLFFDSLTGKVWLSVAKAFAQKPPTHKGFNLGVHVAEIELSTGRALEPFRMIKYSTVGNGVCEGSHIFSRGDYYYLITADGGTEIEHQEWVCRSRSGPHGPWEIGEKDVVNPIVYQGADPYIRQTGHMDVVEGHDGRWWAVFLGVRPVQRGSNESELSQLGRETFIAPISWENDWPVVNSRRPITINLETKGCRSPENFVRSFSFSAQQDLYLDGWYRLRTPVVKDYSLTERPGYLAIYGSPYDLSMDEAESIFLQKQNAFEGQWTVTVEVGAQRPGEEAGTAVFWSKWAYASLGIRGTAQGREVVFRYPHLEGDDFKEAIIPQTQAQSTMTIRVEATPTLYKFFYSFSSPGGYEEIGSVASELLVRTRPFDSIFTGTHLALYSHGKHGESCLAPAFFSDVSWVGKRQGGE